MIPVLLGAHRMRHGYIVELAAPAGWLVPVSQPICLYVPRKSAKMSRIRRSPLVRANARLLPLNAALAAACLLFHLQPAWAK